MLLHSNCKKRKKIFCHSSQLLYFCRAKIKTMIVKIYNENPNIRDVRKVVGILQQGGIVVVPTDTLYAFVCSMEFKKSVESIAQLKGYKLKQAKYSMLCQSLSQLTEYVRPLDKDVFGILKQALPGPFTFILDANNNVPRNYQNANKTIGMRVPDNAILKSLIEELGCPLIGTSVKRVGEEVETEFLTDPELIHESFGHQVDAVVDGGIGDDEPSTLVDCSNGNFEILRQGKGFLQI